MTLEKQKPSILEGISAKHIPEDQNPRISIYQKGSKRKKGSKLKHHRGNIHDQKASMRLPNTENSDLKHSEVSQQRVSQLSPTSAGRERTQPILESNVAHLVKLKMYRSNPCILMHEEKFKNI